MGIPIVQRSAACVAIILAIALSLALAIASTSGGTHSGAQAVQSNDTSYDMNVLVIKYFPLTPDGQDIDINVTGDVGDPYSFIRQRTIDVTNNLINSLGQASTYLGHSNPSSQAALRYHLVDVQEHETAFPIGAGTSNKPDYYKVLSDHGICNFVNGQGVQEVWIWAYQGPGPQLAISESKMSGPFGDISNSWRLDDMPHCGKTYRAYTFNYGRGTAEATESWSHQIEAEIDAINSDVFRNKFQGPNYPQTLNVSGRCGSNHNPPNARFEYDRSNAAPQMSDCLDWHPDGLGQLSAISCQNWGCADNGDRDNPPLNYQIWNWQNLPGRQNTKTYQGQAFRNLWDIHGDFDNVMEQNRTIFMGNGTTATPVGSTPSPPPVGPTPSPPPVGPTPSPPPVGPTPSPSGPIRVWGDNNCSGSADPVDSLLTLRFDAGLSANTGSCPEMGVLVDVQNASPHPWGDVDCDGDVTPVDSLKLLRSDAGLGVAQELDCPLVGVEVTVVE